ncbi:Uncharacterized protein TCM_042709 [Theobroma cacao]|uniref:Uncharacterized protein n=1 Tax=Theobroma cacao TaxID=3641 RepID=A0A061FLU0_THECC|nr:Uncharacterized protein TCM_042709 [Theobroma cacao]
MSTPHLLKGPTPTERDPKSPSFKRQIKQPRVMPHKSKKPPIVPRRHHPAKLSRIKSAPNLPFPFHLFRFCFSVFPLSVMEIYEHEEGYMTPRRPIQTASPPCPPAPKKKRPVYEKVEPPKGGFFKPPGLEALFSDLVPRREACV